MRKALDPTWQFVSDAVMGGVSAGAAAPSVVGGREAMRLQGRVSLENNGGFLQMAFDLRVDGRPLDASAWEGIEIDVFGNDETYEMRLRTDALARPWQSFRSAFVAPPEWTTLRRPFGAFAPHRTTAPFDPAGLRRIGALAIGREFEADLAVGGVGLYRG